MSTIGAASSYSRKMRDRSRDALWAASACATLLLLDGIAAFAWPFARSLDSRMLAAFLELTGSSRIDSLAAEVARWTPMVCATVGAAAVVVALLRGRRLLALAMPFTVGAALATSEALKPLTAHARHTAALGLAQIAPGSWPSGHTTAAMIVALCAVVVAPSRLRPAVALLGGAFVLAVAYSMLVLGAHYPSDVLGGFLVAGTWMSLMLWGLWRREDRAVTPSPARRGLHGALVTSALVAACLAVLTLSRALLPSQVHEGASLILGGSALALAVAAITAGVVSALQPQPRVSGSAPQRHHPSA